MKKSRILMVSALMAFAFAFASCGSAGEKAKVEKAEVECEHAAKDTCEHAAKDTCDHAKTEAPVAEGGQE